MRPRFLRGRPFQQLGANRVDVGQLVALGLRGVEDDTEATHLLHALLITVFGLDLRCVLARSEDRDSLLALASVASELQPLSEPGYERGVGALAEDQQVVAEAVAVERRSYISTCAASPSPETISEPRPRGVR